MSTYSNTDSEAGNLPLAGIRVLEMGQLIAGPFAGQILAAFGAEVVKVEPPGRGDPLRSWRKLDEEGVSYWWRSIGRNKKSITLDLSADQGRQIAHELIMKSDVVLENFRPGRMEAWGLGPDSFAQSHKELIYARVSGYGQDGPYAGKPGFASACEAMAGLRYVNGHPGEKPVRMNLSLGDSLAGMHAALGVLLALISRLRNTSLESADSSTAAAGTGQLVDISIMESVFNMMEGVLPEYTGAGVIREPSGSTVTGIVPTNTYRCSDGRFVVIGGNGDSIFKRLVTAIGRVDMCDDTRFKDNQGRVAHESTIDDAIAAWAANISSTEALQVLEAADVPVGPVNSIEDILGDEQFQARGVFESVNLHSEERVMPAMHPRLSKTPATTKWAGPELGEHTREVLSQWLDTDEERLTSWRAAGII